MLGLYYMAEGGEVPKDLGAKPRKVVNIDELLRQGEQSGKEDEREHAKALRNLVGPAYERSATSPMSPSVRRELKTSLPQQRHLQNSSEHRHRVRLDTQDVDAM